MTPPRSSRSRRRRSVLVAMLLVALAGLAACGDDRPDGFSADTRAAMLRGCGEEDVDPDLLDVCECTYDRMVADLGWTEFAALERRIANGDDRLPGNVVGMIRDCIREVAGTRT